MMKVFVEAVGAGGRSGALLLRFPYHREAVAAVKRGLDRAWRAGKRPPVGAWLPTLRAWCVAFDAWPDVWAELRAKGFPVVPGTPPGESRGA
jgi:hypothetical protein